MKRFVIILLALLSGLSVPQAVAAAAGRQADASVIAAPAVARAAQPGHEAHARITRPRHVFVAAVLPASPQRFGAPAVPTVQRSDRARE